jgi:hypothetical protein
MYIRHLKGSIEDLVHPMLLPMIILTDKIGGRSEQEHREARFLIRDIESRLNTYGHNLATTQVHANRSSSDLNTINADLTYCHSLVWKHPRSYLDLIDDFQEALNAFLSSLPNYVGAYKRILPVHMRMLSRLKFSRQRMRGMDAFAQSTLSRIDMQRTTLHNILLNRQTQTVLQIEERQQREAHAKFCENQRWSRSQMSLSLLGTLFLPGAFIAVRVKYYTLLLYNLTRCMYAETLTHHAHQYRLYSAPHSSIFKPLQTRPSYPHTSGSSGCSRSR